MRIHLYGNTLNFAYNITRWMRAKGVDASVFVEFSPYGQDYPWWEDPATDRQRVPDWVHLLPPMNLVPWGGKERQFIREFSQCDGIWCYHYGPIYAVATGKPYVMGSFGPDLNDWPFYSLDPSFLLELLRGKGLHLKLRHNLGAVMLRRGIRRADAIAISTPNQYEGPLRKLGIQDKGVFIPLPIDLTRYENGRTTPSSNPQVDALRACDLVLFHPTRHVYSDRRIGYGHYKGNDKLFRAFADFVKVTDKRVVLAAVEKGRDVAKTKQLIRTLGIEERVIWLAEMTKPELSAFYSLPNLVVCDQFNERPGKQWSPWNWGVLGTIGLEALGYSRVLLTSFSRETMGQFYPSLPPVFGCDTEEEIYRQLIRVSELDASERVRLGREGRDWVWTYHHWENVIDKYIDLLERVIRERQTGCRPVSKAVSGGSPA